MAAKREDYKPPPKRSLLVHVTFTTVLARIALCVWAEQCNCKAHGQPHDDIHGSGPDTNEHEA
jgi:hypothetical protein